jgi:hypothetical protein
MGGRIAPEQVAGLDHNRWSLWIITRGRLHRNTQYVESFRGRKHVYLDVDEWKYWTMGSPLDDTILINRARTEKQRNICS